MLPRREVINDDPLGLRPVVVAAGNLNPHNGQHGADEPTAPDGGPDVSGLRAFVCGPGQGISYGVGVWHHPIIALDDDADFVMLAWEDGTALDCIEHPLSASILITDA